MLCDYGCGKEASYTFDNGKHCCSDHFMKCVVYKNKIKGKNNPFFKKTHTKESKDLIGQKNKGKTPWNKNIPRTQEEKENISIKTKEGMSRLDIKEKLKTRPVFKKEKHPRWTGGYYTNKLPLYSTYMPQIYFAEKCRQSPSDKNILEVKCKYCDKWFIPTTIQVYERIRCLNGNASEGYMYCSHECKSECPIFHQISYPKGFKPSTSREVQSELRQMRFKLDNYTCQKCNKHQDELDVGLHCHHLEGIRWDPIESADLDKVITLCKSCHIEVHKKEGCGYHDMRCGK